MNTWVYLTILYLAMGFGYAIIISRLSLREPSNYNVIQTDFGWSSGKKLFGCFRGMMCLLFIASQILADM